MLRRFRFAFLSVSLCLTVAGCDCDGPSDPDGGPLPDGALPDGAMIPDGGMPPDGPTITICPGDALEPLASGDICEATAGDGNLLITGDVLTPGEVFRGGQVLVDPQGRIACVGCDCSGEAGASGATTVVCPDGVVSPGLINAHEHITFQSAPASGTPERYEHRHDWRTGSRGHTEIPSRDGFDDSISWDELRMVMAGVTSVNGSGSANGLARNLDRSAMEGLGQPQVEYETFPLGDSGGTLASDGCDRYSVGSLTDETADIDAYTPHVAEGIDAEARNEFLCLREEDGAPDGSADIIRDNTSLIHGVGLLAPDIAEMADEQTSLIWSPRSNIALYGDTARLTVYDRLGVLVAMGTDWQRSGSMNMLRELRCADELNADYFGGHFSDEDLWLMATYNGAVATATDDVIGVLAAGRVADIAIFDGSINVDHRAVIDAEPEDIALVLRGGDVLYGEQPVVDTLATGCDAIDVCGAPRAACVQPEIGTSLADLSAMNEEGYPLFFCDVTPTDEPTCVPSRDAMDPLPSPIVDGSNRYTGMITAEDMDGDGIDNGMDICPAIFNPVRPMDDGAQADFDEDGLGDECDPCPLDADTTTCTAVDPNDRDRDMVVDTMDNCPGVPNMDQADADGDDIGDACDLCPDDPNPGGSACPGTIYDVKDGTIGDGNRVRVTESVVTAVGDSGFAMQVPTDHPDYDGVDFSGVYVYTFGPPELSDGTAVARGMTVDVDGTVDTFMGQTQIGFVTVTMSATSRAVPSSETVADPATIATGGSRAAALESVLVTIEDVAVTDASTAPDFEVEGTLVVGGFFYLIDPFVSMGENFDAITGVVFGQGGSRLLPRDADDFLAGAPQLDGLTPDAPAVTYARIGDGSVMTFPEPLTVHLTRAAGSATTITITSTGAAGDIAVSDVVVPAGSASAIVPVEGLTAGTYDVTATLGADSDTETVRVLGDMEAAADFTLSPTSATVNVTGTVTFEVTLDIPAPPGGTRIDISEDTGGTLTPASMVVVPEDALRATFDYTAPASETTGTLTATLFGTSVMRTASLTVVMTPGTVIINEVDYDQDGTDGAEFIELYNPGAVAVDLTDIQLLLVNGSGGTVYETIDLSTAGGSLPAGGYLVVRAPGLAVMGTPLTIDFSSATNNVQNGAPDGIAVWDAGESMLLDALSYEGSITSATIGGMTLSLVEGTAATAIDDPAGDMSLARLPDGSDTDDADTDWAATSCLTPGAANTMSCP